MATIKDYSAAYEAAKKKGDTAGMNAAHAAADKIRGGETITKVVNGKYVQETVHPSWIPKGDTGKPADGNNNTGGYGQPVMVKDNSQAAKAAYIASQLGQLGINYATNKANIDTAYNRNLSNAGVQKDVINDQFGDIKQDVNQSTFDAMRYNKQMGSQRGITNSAQMLGADVATQRAGNNQMFAAEKDKNLAINGIQSFITQLGEAYGVDKNTLESNYGTAKLKAMSDGELMALESQLKVDMFNAGALNQFSLADKNYTNTLNLNTMQNDFTAGQNELNRGFEKSENALNRNFTAEQSALDRGLSSRLASISASNQSSMFKQQQSAGLINDYVSQVLLGFDKGGKLTPAQTQMLNNAAYQAGTSGSVDAFNKLVGNLNTGISYMK